MPIEDSYYLFKFPPTGQIQTSTGIEYGTAKDKYYYYSGETRLPLKDTGWGYGGMIWGDFTGNRGETTYEFLFIGTEEELKSYGAKVGKDEQSNPKVGSIK